MAVTKPRKRPGRVAYDLPVDEIAACYKSGMSIREIAVRYNVSLGVIWNRLHTHGVEMRTARTQRLVNDPAFQQEVIDLYEAGVGMYVIAADKQIAQANIRKILVDNNIRVAGYRGPGKRQPDVCRIEGCESDNVIAHGLCWKHYGRWRRFGDPLHPVKVRGDGTCYACPYDPRCENPAQSHGQCSTCIRNLKLQAKTGIPEDERDPTKSVKDYPLWREKRRAQIKSIMARNRLLTDEQEDHIREWYASEARNGLTMKMIAEHYGVSIPKVSLVIHRTTPHNWNRTHNLKTKLGKETYQP